MKKLITLTLCIIMSLSSLSIYGCGKCKHTYDEKITKVATCTEIGIKTFTCSSCGNAYTDTIPTTNHSYAQEVVKPTLNEQGYTIHTCEYCGDSFKDSYTNKLEWMEVFVDYISQNFTSRSNDNGFTIQKTFKDSIYDVNLHISYYPDSDKISFFTNYTFSTESYVTYLYLQNKPRDKYEYDFYFMLGSGDECWRGKGYVSAQELYSLNSLTFDTYYQSTNMSSSWKARCQKNAATYLKKLCKQADQELKSWNVGLDLSYWGIEY